jgi:hypothetical protein
LGLLLIISAGQLTTGILYWRGDTEEKGLRYKDIEENYVELSAIVFMNTSVAFPSVFQAKHLQYCIGWQNRFIGIDF